MWFVAVAVAQESQTFTARPVAGFEVAELRGGVQGGVEGGAASLCLEVDSPWGLGLDACGSGAGFLYPSPAGLAEMVHFRLEGTIPVYTRGRVAASVQPGLGFAEIERGADAPGFLFGDARSRDQREAAGVEGAVSGKLRYWPHERFFVTGEVSVGAGYLPAAPVVLGHGGPWVPFALGTVGVGF